MLNFGPRKDNSRIRYKGRSPYVTKTYENPFFSSRQRRLPALERLPGRLRYAIYGFAALALALSAVFLYSGYFSIKEFVVEGQGRIRPDDVRALAGRLTSGRSYLVLPEANLLVYDRQALADALNASYGLDSLEIKSDWPDRLAINYREKPYSFIVQEGDSYSYIDQEGLKLSDANILEVQQRDYPIIRLDALPPRDGNKFSFNPGFLKASQEIFYALKPYDDLPVERFIYEGKLKTVTAKILEGPLLYFSSEQGIAGQIEKVLLFKNERLGPDFFKKQYIDVQYGTNVYYK